MAEGSRKVGLKLRWHVLLVVGILSLALTIGFQAASAQRGGSPPPPAELDYLCVNGYTGIIRGVSSPACQPHETLLTLPDDYPFLACANNYTGLMRYAGDGPCRSYEADAPMPPEEQEMLLCLMPSTGILKLVSSPSYCPAGGTISGVIPAPEVIDDTYTALGNVPIDVPKANGLLTNDTTNTGILTAFDPTSTNGGTVAVEPDGSFHYTPSVGFTGTDTFTYTISNSSGNVTGTVTVEVGEPLIWFVDSALATNGDGSAASPFNTLAAVNDAGVDSDAPGEFIYLFESTTTYSGGIVLENDQTLVGQEVGLAATGVTVPPFATLPPVNPSAEVPTITNASGNGVTLAPGAVVAGLTVDGTSDSGVSGTGFTGDATLDRVTVSAPGNGEPAVNLSAIDGTVTLTGSEVTGRNHTSRGGTALAATDVTALEILNGSTVRGGNGQRTIVSIGASGGTGLAGANVAITIDAATVRGGNGGPTDFGNGGRAGVAVDLTSAELTVSNGGGVTGGDGGRGWEDGGAGGAAISGNDLTIDINGSSLNGGVGGTGVFNAGGTGGPATDIVDSTLTVTGSTVTGGNGNESWDVRGGAGATAIAAQDSVVTIQGGSTVTGGSGGGVDSGAPDGFGAPGVNTNDTDLTITASTVSAGGGSPAESAVTITNDGGTETVAATLTDNTLTSSGSVPSLLVQTNITTSSICLNASGNSDGSGGAPAGPFTLDNNFGILGVTQTTELALSEDNNDVQVVIEDGVIGFSCTQG